MNPRREEERRLSNGEEVKWLKSSPVRGEAHLYIYIYIYIFPSFVTIEEAVSPFLIFLLSF